MPPPEPVSAHALLLEHQAFLQRLARSLVSDPQRAEDLVQDVALLTLRNPPRPTGSMRAWLARVLRNRAISLARSEGRRNAREALAPAPEAPRTPPEIEAHFQVQRRVVDAVERLEEPYRSVILLRYHQDLGPGAIAERLELPLATVKTRLARGLERLRRDLDEHDLHGAPAWSLVLLGGLAQPSRPTTGAALATGGAIMGVKLVWSGVAVAAIAGTWWMLREPARPVEQVAAQPTAVPAPIELAGIDGEPRDLSASDSTPARSPAAAAPESVEKPPAVPDWSLQLSLRGWRPGDSGPVAIDIHRPEREQPALVIAAELVDTQVLDLASLFADADTRPDQLRLRIDHRDYLPEEVALMVPQDLLTGAVDTGSLQALVTLELARYEVTGRVELDDQDLADELRVAIFPLEEGRPAREPTETVRPAADGRYRLRADAAEEHVVLAFLRDRKNTDGRRESRAHLRPDSRVIAVPAADTLELEPLVLGPGEAIEGFVVAPGGGELPRGTLTLERSDGWSFYGDGLTWSEGRFELQQLDSPLAPDGQFRFGGLSRAAYTLSTRTSGRSRQDIPVIRVADGSDALAVSAPASDVRVPLGHARTLFVVFGEGRPVQRAPIQVQWQGTHGRGGGSGTKTDSLGQVYLELGPESEVTFRVEDPRYPFKELQVAGRDLVPDGLIEVHLDGPALEPATLLVHLGGTPGALGTDGIVSFWLYEIEGKSAVEIDAIGTQPLPMSFASKGTAQLHRSSTRIQSNFRADTWTLIGIPRSRYLIRALPTGPDMSVPPLLLPTSFEVDLRSEELNEYTWLAEVGGLLRLNLSSVSDLNVAVLRTPDGQQVLANYISGRPGVPGHSLGSAATQPAIYDLSPALPAGDYRLEVSLQGGGKRSLAVRVEAGKVNDLVVAPEDL